MYNLLEIKAPRRQVSIQNHPPDPTEQFTDVYLHSIIAIATCGGGGSSSSTSAMEQTTADLMRPDDAVLSIDI